ncbi:MAG: ribonuclease Y [bacterium]
MSSLLTSIISTFRKPAGIKTITPKVEKIVAPKVVKQDTKDAENSATAIITFAREEAQKIRETARVEMNALSDSLRELKTKLENQENEVARRENNLEAKKTEIEKNIAATEITKTEIAEVLKKQLDKLERIATLTRDKAKDILLESVQKKLQKEIAERIRAAEDEIKETVEDKANNMLVDAMYHGATDYVAEFTISIVKIPDDEVKGRIIGKEGRNIRTFEKVTGVDIDMDETPGEVRLSCYDAVRREIARVALERLIKDGRIQPTRIEEYVAKAKRDIDKIVFEEGKKLCHAVGAYNVPHDLIAMLGRFKYRTSYGQNMITHTLEETKMGMKIAAELHANVDTVRLGCLFHDIGKLIDEEGSHIELGVALLKRYNMSQAVIDTVAQHHEDEEFSCKESIIVYIADAISGSRPGARYENYDEYIKRLKDLESIAMSKPGVSEAFAIQAGREVRVIVDPERATDDEAVLLASAIRDEIKATVTYPGTVTVTVIRERRTSAVAK